MPISDMCALRCSGQILSARAPSSSGTSRSAVPTIPMLSICLKSLAARLAHREGPGKGAAAWSHSRPRACCLCRSLQRTLQDLVLHLVAPGRSRRQAMKQEGKMTARGGGGVGRVGGIPPDSHVPASDS